MIGRDWLVSFANFLEELVSYPHDASRTAARSHLTIDETVDEAVDRIWHIFGLLFSTSWSEMVDVMVDVRTTRTCYNPRLGMGKTKTWYGLDSGDESM